MSAQDIAASVITGGTIVFVLGLIIYGIFYFFGGKKILHLKKEAKHIQEMENQKLRAWMWRKRNEEGLSEEQIYNVLKGERGYTKKQWKTAKKILQTVEVIESGINKRKLARKDEEKERREPEPTREERDIPRGNPREPEPTREQPRNTRESEPRSARSNRSTEEYDRSPERQRSSEPGETELHGESDRPTKRTNRYFD